MAPAKPTKRELELVAKIRDASDDLMRAQNYAETYMGRVALARAVRGLVDWELAGRPLRREKAAS